jgi:colicin import membrane protein
LKVLRKYFIPICLAVLVHVVLFSLFFLNFRSDPENALEASPEPEIIQATSLDENKVIREIEKLQQAELDKRSAEQQRQTELEDKRAAEQEKLEQLKFQHQEQKTLEQQRQEQAKKAESEHLTAMAAKQKQEQEKLASLKQQQAEEQKRLDEIAQKKKDLEEKHKKEEKRLAQLEKQRKEQLKKAEQERIDREKAAQLAAKQKAEEATRLKAEAATRQKMDAEQAAAESVRQGKIINNATRMIMRNVERSWRRPPGTQDGLSATIRVRVLPGGSVKDATVVVSSGNPAFDRSAELAVRKASPLPVPSDPEIFNKFLPTFTFNFSPS